ncbi:ZIP zinc/iron transport family [Hanseniaspora valbyensis NRRL Y-1626]|uniref:ZIP zinc/iron transport family n=1 Tax=Hanseniaspora valbyensis NRRL Y-1626 TaxID=766949 RepID=A0A1B7TGP8_9ASCO|nr:ZIP zinc/iron transport family [Hanseniaspora valbyensis NRRL Y-1626]
MENIISLSKRHVIRDSDDDSDACPSASEYNGHLNLRILSIFMILISSAIGIYLPIITSYYRKSANNPVVKIVFFIARYFGQGVIFATAFIHLLQPANESLTAACLTGAWQEYPFAFAICMGASFGIYLLEIVTRYYLEKLTGVDEGMHGHGHMGSVELVEKNHLEHHGVQTHMCEKADGAAQDAKQDTDSVENTDTDTLDDSGFEVKKHLSYENQLLSVCILEFGIIFHSVFVGLTLGVVGDEFKTLFCVLVFHQMFEGAACGTRIVELGRSHITAQLLFGLLYSLTTPVSIAIGVGVRHSLSMSSMKATIVSGCFDSVSAGILLYNAFELLFMAFNEHKGNLKMKLVAYVTTCFGVGIMALLGKWA